MTDQDIPEELKKLRQKHPNIDLPHIELPKLDKEVMQKLKEMAGKHQDIPGMDTPIRFTRPSQD